jgi:preprotein translocase subunit YajC
MNFSLLVANAAQAPGGIKGLLVSFGPFILIIVVMYFLLFRSQRKKTQERRRMLDAMRAGDKVVTAGGLIGTIASVKDKIVVIKVAESTQVEVSRASISGILEKKAD